MRETRRSLYGLSPRTAWSYGDCYIKYMWVNIRCMLDWIIGFGHKTAEINFFGMSAQLVSAQNETLLWLAGQTKRKFEPTARLSIWWHNLVKRGKQGASGVGDTIKINVGSANKNWIQTWGPVVRWKIWAKTDLPFYTPHLKGWLVWRIWSQQSEILY